MADVLNILYDHPVFTYQRYGGISRYFVELFRQFQGMPDLQWELGAVCSDNEYLAALDIVPRPRYPAPFGHLPPLVRTFLEYRRNRRVSIAALKAQAFDLFHPTFYDPYFLEFLGVKPFVVTIHDMTPELYPELFDRPDPYSRHVTMRWVRAKRELARRARRVLVVSRNTRDDVARFYGIAPDRMDVIHHGAPGLGLCRPDPSVVPPGDYLLYVGTRTRYKGFDWLLRVLPAFLARRPGWRLVCAGGGRFSRAERASIEAAGLAGRCLRQDVSDAGLAALYRRARAFVFPSEYEGFGIPILEAFACDCPVVLPRASCFPEVAGEAGLYYETRHEASFLATLERAVDDRDWARGRVEQGRRELRRFSWEATARQTVEAYRRCL
jgi:glycosyltransferase involved in cell wall biosynthesis